MKALETSRLIIDEMTRGDALFVLEILNDSDFIRYVADRGIRTEQQACDYLENRVMASYKEHGFGMAAVRLKATGEIIGMCGLIKRDSLKDVDIGYGFLPSSRGQGYACEAAEAVMAMGRREFGLRRIVAIIHPENKASRALAERIGMHLDSMICLAADEDEVCLYLTTSGSKA